ncbi:MAG: LysM peptidoglycan-binding domain-containing protein [Parabacteroides sp.]|nr:LysM peptidoglycan-binding domain-containing protein [Parabacteroides sp.]
MGRSIYILSLFCCFAIFGFAQNTNTQSSEYTESLYNDVGVMPESLDENIDSLMHSWNVQYFSKKDNFCHDDIENVYFDDSVYVERLQRLPHIIPMPYNSIVRRCIDLYAARKRNLVRYMVGMADFYFPMIEQVLDKYKLPLELKYLTVVESALNPTALSRVGASGLWQFMLPVGKSYGLEINSLMDERRDPVKATEAACKYFKDMYAIYGDWDLVLASYNCGPGNVNKAIRRSGGKTDFWQIFPYLPRETRSYVPLFIAANYIMNYYCEHNICPVQTNLPLATDTVMVNKMLHLQQISDVLGIDMGELRALNPQYRHDIVPGNMGYMALKLPAAQTYAFVDKEDSIYAYKRDELLANSVQTNMPVKEDVESAVKKVTHIVRKGENIYSIAHRYGISANSIRKWNRLRSNKLAKGRRLILKIEVDKTLLSENNVSKKRNKSEKKATPVSSKCSSLARYKVRSGDSLYSIAKKYPGISPEALRKANKLSDSSIRPGQVLKIPVV